MTAEESQTSRIDYLDWAKGLGICLIILGHNPLPGMINSWIYSFHVPLFFIISGYFYKQRSFSTFLKKNAQQLLLPLLVTEIICFVIRLLMHTPFQDGYVVGFCSQLFAINGKALPAVWFLYALFFAKIILFVSIKLFKEAFLVVPLICFFVVWYYHDSLASLDLPFHLLPALCAPLFLGIGVLCRRLDIFNGFSHPSVILFAVVALFVNWHAIVYFKSAYFPNALLSVITSSISSIAVILLLKQLNSIIPQAIHKAFYFLMYMGRYSLVVLCFHCIDRICGFTSLLTWLPGYWVGIVNVLALAFVPLLVKYIPVVRYCYNVRK